MSITHELTVSVINSKMITQFGTYSSWQLPTGHVHRVMLSQGWRCLLYVHVHWYHSLVAWDMLVAILNVTTVNARAPAAHTHGITRVVIARDSRAQVRACACTFNQLIASSGWRDRRDRTSSATVNKKGTITARSTKIVAVRMCGINEATRWSV